MTYSVKEIFLTHQGEGANIGRLAVFVRFAGCNLWSGREEDRDRAVCRFCDTDFVGGNRYTAVELSKAASDLWPSSGQRFCVLTGGEPLLQVDVELILELRANNFLVAVETNGTCSLPCDLDWVCVSPKTGTKLALKNADELKLVYPQDGIHPEDFADFVATHRWLSPMDLKNGNVVSTRATLDYCKSHPEWRLAIQAHKYWNVR